MGALAFVHYPLYRLFSLAEGLSCAGLQAKPLSLRPEFNLGIH